MPQPPMSKPAKATVTTRTSQKKTSNGEFAPSTPFWPETHEVENQPHGLVNYNIYGEDKALQEAVAAHNGSWGEAELMALGARLGTEEVVEWGFQANAFLNKPVLHTHNRYGARIDEVSFHPSYHNLHKLSVENGLHSTPWREPKPGAHVVRAAKNFLMSQVDTGHLCPVTMTMAAIPSLKHQPDLYEKWAPKIMAYHYDPRNVHHDEKKGVTIGMAMTEKQGGSDVRANSTRALPKADGGPGQEYLISGHKYFVSAPMCDAFLMLAQAPGGLSCFLVPRWRDDGTKNPLQIQQLKNKMGNVSNASSETEIRGATGWLIGPEGRGVAAIIDMVAMTRFDCMTGSAAMMRQATHQAVNHCSQRSAFGALLTEQPLMQNVLADMILESEASIAMCMRMGRALDECEQSDHEKLLARMGTAVGKYWVCKRATLLTTEAMECIGGMGVMEDTIMPRLVKEAPVNSIWEGSGNVQCLDMLRAMTRNKGSLEAFMGEMLKASGSHALYDKALADLQEEFSNLDDIEYRARTIVGKMALAFQASCLFLHGDLRVAEAFCLARLSGDHSGWVFGQLPGGVDCKFLIERVAK